MRWPNQDRVRRLRWMTMSAHPISIPGVEASQKPHAYTLRERPLRPLFGSNPRPGCRRLQRPNGLPLSNSTPAAHLQKGYMGSCALCTLGPLGRSSPSRGYFLSLVCRPSKKQVHSLERDRGQWNYGMRAHTPSHIRKHTHTDCEKHTHTHHMCRGGEKACVLGRVQPGCGSTVDDVPWWGGAARSANGHRRCSGPGAVRGDWDIYIIIIYDCSTYLFNTKY